MEGGLSYDAIRWAMSQPVSKSAAKFVLVALADCVNADGAEMLCWPSVQHLADTTGQDRKTVIDGLRRLREEGFIVDTGARRGSTGQVPVYALKTPKNGTVSSTSEGADSRQEGRANSPESGTDLRGQTVPDFPANSPVFPYEESRFSLSTVPKTGHGTSKEPIRNQEEKKTPRTRVTDLPIPGVDAQLQADYKTVRTAKGAGAITQTVINGLQREAAKAGISVADAVTFCCEAGWQGFNAGWYADRVKGRASGSVNRPTGNKHTAAAAAIFGTRQPQEYIDV